MMAELAPTVAWAREYPPANAPTKPVMSRDGLLALAEDQLRSHGELRWTTRHKRDRIQARADLLEEELLRLQDEHDRIVAPTVERFRQLDWTTNIVVFQEVFADNGLAAVALDLRGSDLDVLMTYPEPDDIIWPEKFDYRENLTLGVKKKTKREIREEYKLVMLQHMCATAKEALQTQPALTSARVIAVREADGVRLADLEVLGDLTVLRSDVQQLCVEGDWSSHWDEALDIWDKADGVVPHDPDFRFEMHLMDVTEMLDDQRARLEGLAARLAGRQDRKSKGLTTLGPLAEVLNNPAINEFDDEGAFEDLATIEAEDDLILNSHDFWLHVAATVELWSDDVG